MIVHQYDHTLAVETLLYNFFPWLGRVCDKYMFPMHGALAAGLGSFIFHHLQQQPRRLLGSRCWLEKVRRAEAPLGSSGMAACDGE